MDAMRYDFGAYTEGCLSAAHQVDSRSIELLLTQLEAAQRERRFVFVCGNGGSAATASHLCEDLGKGLSLRSPPTPRLRILSLTDNTPYILAWANDTSFDRIFVEQLKNLASEGDFLIAISGSGNSPNVLKAVEWADRAGLTTWAITGFDGGRLRTLARHSIHVPVSDMGMTETVHLMLFHWILDELVRRSSAPTVLAEESVLAEV